MFEAGWAGFIAVILTAGLFSIFRALRLVPLSPASLIGCIFRRDPRHPAMETLGFILLVLLGSTVVPAIYNWLFGLTGGPSLARGTALGSVHGLVAAGILPLYGTISACVRDGAIPTPGPMGIKWGWLTPFALLVGHGFYGAVYGAILANL